MQMGNLVREDRFTFRGNTLITATGSASDLPWRKNVAGSTPATIGPSGGDVELALTSFDGAQSCVLHMDDVLSYDIDELIAIDFVWSLTLSGSTPDVAFGVASTGLGETTVAGLEDSALFRVNGDSLALKAMTEVGGTTTSETSNQIVGGGDYFTSRIDFATGVKPFSDPRSLPNSGKGAITFLSGNPSNGRALEKLVSTEFDLSSYSGSVQPVALLAKGSGTDTCVLKIREICVQYKAS